jgi:hypothetical protein
MLMKIHVAGFTLTDTKPGTFNAPYPTLRQGESVH